MITFFLWPMLIPMIIPLVYCRKWKKESLKDIWLIIIIMLLIVILYEPLAWNLDFPFFGYIFWKFVLFVFLPLGIFYWYLKDKKTSKILPDFGVRKKGMEKSLLLCAIFIPLMLATDAIVSILLGRSYPPGDNLHSGIMFVESFTEEFFFRGILFLYLWKVTDVRVAYVTSIMSFVLMHPQHFWGLGMVSAIVQGVLTAVIVHKSKNLAGAWLLHGANRVFSISILPWFL
ncbi:MAG: CPBP family intramembrane metalloprotease [Candidatus Thermoplasmatota archaeon]|nr:CPBP family intramembrane metalloprotease [Candidatus Thermoplasmatota archaeon]